MKIRSFGVTNISNDIIHMDSDEFDEFVKHYNLPVFVDKQEECQYTLYENKTIYGITSVVKNHMNYIYKEMKVSSKEIDKQVADFLTKKNKKLDK